MGICSDGPYECSGQFEVRSFMHSWDNWGYLKTLGSPSLCPRYFFSKIFNGCLFRWNLYVPAKFEVRSFTRSWDNSEYLKNFVQSLDTPFKVVQGRWFWYQSIFLNVFRRTVGAWAATHAQSEVLILLNKSKYRHKWKTNYNPDHNRYSLRRWRPKKRKKLDRCKNRTCDILL